MAEKNSLNFTFFKQYTLEIYKYNTKKNIFKFHKKRGVEEKEQGG